jgi:hypothetical protein
MSTAGIGSSGATNASLPTASYPSYLPSGRTIRVNLAGVDRASLRPRSNNGPPSQSTLMARSLGLGNNIDVYV